MLYWQTMSEISSAFSAFGKRLSRFTKANPGETPVRQARPDDITQRRIMERDEAFSEEVIRTYAKYRFPYKTLGEDSIEAATIKSDEDALLAAYNLYKAVLAANEQFASEQSRIKDDVIVSSLARKSAYTQGDSFVYLQCWLRYEQKVEDFVPHFFRVSARQQQDEIYTLQFVPAASYHTDYRKKEIIAIIQSEFYPEG